MKALCIKDWHDNFQLSQNARIGRWGRLPIPIRLDGEHYRRLMATPAGRGHYAVFISLAAVAANMPVRGVLAKGDGPLSVEALNIRTGIPVRALRASIAALLDPALGWLVETEWTPSPVGVKAENAPSTVGSSLSQTNQPNSQALALAKPQPSGSGSGTAAADACASNGSEAAGGLDLSVLRALREFWPNGRTATELARNPAATPLRVLWLLERVRTERLKKPGRDGQAGFIRAGIEGGWEVDATWVNKNRERLSEGGYLNVAH